MEYLCCRKETRLLGGIGWVWLGIEATHIIRKMNTEQLALQTKLGVLTAYTGALGKDGKNWQTEALCLSFVNLVSTVVLQTCAEKRTREPEVSMSSARLSSENRIVWEGEAERQRGSS